MKMTYCDIFIKAQPESLATSATHNMSRYYLLLLPSCHPTLLSESVQPYPPLAPTFLPQIEINVPSIFSVNEWRRKRGGILVNLSLSELGTVVQRT